MRKEYLFGVAMILVTLLTQFQDSMAQSTPQERTAGFINAQGQCAGKATLRETPHGVLIQAQLKGLTPGWHAFHIHETGQCTTPDFKAAGGHFNPDKKVHGFAQASGAHAGDMPNVFANAQGEAHVDVLAPGVTLEAGKPNSILDDNGSALMVHEKADDYRTDPAGDAGGRVLCAPLMP
jgi:Cu-Zn family superoxide dismutase